ncbi:type II toxin-antitoxin system RelE/ParE family toxin [Verminephrobacter eiseniae]|uniref:type II toxin-antitoxin system RelE/ParE family toxin n=1 Tax=Verminephrobacter eiseniae TaxID=364317 RepID=UPI002237E211|nr:type II toxin-antitoxin system RelE/ParE family toxin [Verminephrobacter eiseniae]MCW5233524.1 type II toxin-antitoxin system RelE/ParE family toxin [Verminephrobacter eiseniae]MCW5294921.1 type II toxin-antitoxin system RelE/ParE family toxin [Verminephrobacter eiseniae]MCW8183802.1 type II toxin-antitoxin system RelE/ParE family toxin [Verminephrobacter eiseniae]MCW8222346.1 type II toxin-antitoxin system RelE/ParE family toxin [Verminephrobacter eiseniae]MCW8233943.1 type II toxin-antito
MKVVWRPMAEADREHIFDYIAKNNLGAALELDEEFQAKADNAALNPKLYKPGRVRGTREIVVRPNYVMIYRIDDDGGTLTVLRVLHAARRWPAP